MWQQNPCLTRVLLAWPSLAAQTMSSGAQLGLVDANNDGTLDIAAGSAVGGGKLRLIDGKTFQLIATFSPYGAAFNKGLFVAGAGRGDASVSAFSGNEVTIAGPGLAQVREDGGVAEFTLSRSGDTSSALTVSVSVGGPGGGPFSFSSDFTTTPAASSSIISVTFGVGESSKPITLTESADAEMEGNEVVVFTVQTGAGYTVGTANRKAVAIKDDDSPRLAVPDYGACGPCSDLLSADASAAPPPAARSSGGGVLPASGLYTDTATLPMDLGGGGTTSGGFGGEACDVLSWTNDDGLNSAGEAGDGVVMSN